MTYNAPSKSASNTFKYLLQVEVSMTLLASFRNFLQVEESGWSSFLYCSQNINHIFINRSLDDVITEPTSVHCSLSMQPFKLEGLTKTGKKQLMCVQNTNVGPRCSVVGYI